jgi:hypothetical protein
MHRLDSIAARGVERAEPVTACDGVRCASLQKVVDRTGLRSWGAEPWRWSR